MWLGNFSAARLVPGAKICGEKKEDKETRRSKISGGL
jgi:hypothetical protein